MSLTHQPSTTGAKTVAGALGATVAATISVGVALSSAAPVAIAAPAQPLGSVTSALPGSLSDPGVPTVDPTLNLPTTFDLQAHRGGRGEHTEESRTAFDTAVDLGVTTLELDIHLTRDGVPLVWHDPSLQDDKCTDTAPITPNDPQFPYVGKDVHDLTWDQIQTVVCDRTLSGFSDAVPAVGNRILQLSDVFDIAARDPKIHFNIETKIEAENPSRSASPQEYVDAIISAADTAGATDRIAVQSFDWSTLPLVRERAPQVPLVALWDITTWIPGSPYLGPVDFLAAGGDPVNAAEQLGAQVLSPSFDTSAPWFGGNLSAFIDRAHSRGLRVVPWTINETADMQQ